VVIYEMATGRLPFAGTSPSETVTNVLDKAPEPLTKLSPQQPTRLDRIVRRLLAKRAEDRYQSAAELRRELSTIQESGRSGFWHRTVNLFRR
jgi:serine/threonine-protein kinase